MSTIEALPIDNRRRRADRRTAERRQRNVPVQTERRRTQERRRDEDRRHQDLHALYVQAIGHADQLWSELASVPAGNPMFRLLVLQKFLLAHRPRQSNEWIMQWARRLRGTYSAGGRTEMSELVFLALRGEKAPKPRPS